MKLDRTIKWYMHKPEYLRENMTRKIPLDFEIQADHVIQLGRPNIVLIKKKN